MAKMQEENLRHLETVLAVHWHSMLFLIPVFVLIISRKTRHWIFGLLYRIFSTTRASTRFLRMKFSRIFRQNNSSYKAESVSINIREMRQNKQRQHIISLEEAQRRTSTVNLLEMANDDSSLIPTFESKTHLLDDEAILFICHNLPPRCIGYTWHSVYSTFVHGMSLKTMYRNMTGMDTPVVMVIEDTDHCLFGAVCSCPLRVSDHYYGTGESFLFTLQPHKQVFKWTGANSFFFKGDMDSLSVGGGKGTFGLWIDGDLYHGYSRPCETFGNNKLAYSEDFCIKSIEVWGFRET